MIHFAKGQDRISGEIQHLTAIIRRTQDGQRVSGVVIPLIFSLKIKLFQFIQEAFEEQKQEHERRQFLSRTLSRRVAEKTAYDEQGKLPCDPDTRQDILADIMMWVNDTSDVAQRFYWLTGDPGSGKSAITASIARKCKDDGILWAQFFINRNIADTTNPALYFPSIASQIVEHSPDVALAVYNILKKQPSLMDDISEDQAGGLFVQTLESASSLHPSRPIVVVIDALDETDPTRLYFTATIFSTSLTVLPRNVKVFISSRMEDGIRKPFFNTLDMNRVKNVHLDPSDESSIRDVSVFLIRNMKMIVKQHGLDPSVWQEEERMAKLCAQASGLFIWAITAVKFLRVQVERWGSGRLKCVLDELNSKGMDDINVLYGTILQRTHEGDTHEDDTHEDDIDHWPFKMFRRTVGCIVVLQDSLCLGDIMSLLNLIDPVSKKPADMKHYVGRLRTVLVAGTNAIDCRTIPRLHKSFVEFITSERVGRRFRINVDASNRDVAIQCLSYLAGWRDQRSKNDGDQLPAALSYALQFWSSHFPQAECLDDISDEVDLNATYATILQLTYKDRTDPVIFEGFRRAFGSIIVLREPFCLSELNSLLNLRDHTPCVPIDVEHYIDELHTILVARKDMITGQTVRLPPNTFVRFITSERSESRFRVNLLTSNRDIASQCLRRLAHWSDESAIRPRQDDGCLPTTLRYAFKYWSLHLQKGGTPTGVAILGSRRVLEFLQFSHSNGLQSASISICFMLQGQRITVSADNTVTLQAVPRDKCFTNQRNDPCVGFHPQGHTEAVRSVAYSPDRKRVVSGSRNDTLRFWDAENDQSIGWPIKEHTATVNSVAYSPDGKRVVSGSWDRTVRIWDVGSGQSIGLPLGGHTEVVSSVAYSPDGKQVVSGSWDHTVRIWDVESGQSIGLSLRGHTKAVNSVAYSPDGKRVVSGSWDHTVRIWDVESGQCIGLPLKGHTGAVSSVAYSPDGKQVVSGSLDCTVRIWDVESGQSIGLTLNGHTRAVDSVAYSPDGKQIVSGSQDNTIRLWDVGCGHYIGLPLEGHSKGVTSVAYSPDGEQIVSGSWDRTVRIWEVGSGQCIGLLLKGHTGAVSSVAYSPDGKQVISGSYDKTICLRCVADNEAIQLPLSAYTVHSVASWPDGILTKPYICLQDIACDAPVKFALTDCHDAVDAVQLHWLEVDDTEFGVWAYSNGKVIRRDMGGATSIIDISEVLHKLGISV
jgi:WD40 repeat protein